MDSDLFAGLPRLQDVEVTDEKLGSGSYGNVLKVKVGKSLCAAKEIHDLLLDDLNRGVEDFKRRYADECRTIAQLQHPRIVQFLGIYFREGSDVPLMVMELLHTSLGDLLSGVPFIDLNQKLSILHDVCTGLQYLHGRQEPIIHRDLTANNVLLDTLLRAKIADMGNCRIVDPHRLPQTLTRTPGTQIYMPPEALGKDHRYGPSLDIFSFGHLSLYTLTQECPDSLPSSSFFNEETGLTEARTQVQCRQKYIDHLESLFGRTHIGLIQMVKNCLHDSPKRRPSCEDILATLEEMRPMGLAQEYLRPVSVGRVLMEIELNKKNKEIEALKKKNEEMEAIKRSNEKKIRMFEQKEKEWKEKLESEQKKLESEQEKLKEYQKKLEKSEKERVSKQSAVKDVISMPHKDFLPGPLSIKWDHGRDMPFAITDYSQSVIIGGALYVGGGWTRKRSENNFLVVKFDLTIKVWHQLPAAYSARDFAMVAIEDELVLVGGCDRSNSDTNLLGRFDADNAEWVRPYSPMPTARHNSSAVYCNGFLVVAGGMNPALLSTVEILTVRDDQWHSATEMPAPCYSMKSVTVGNMWYLMGGYEMKAATNGLKKKATSTVYCVSLQDLCSTNAASSEASSDALWKEIPGTGCMFSSPVNINGSLYAVGGKCDDEAISTLSQYANSAGWQIAGKLQSPIYNCTCSFANGILYLAGGYDSTSSKFLIGLLNS